MTIEKYDTENLRSNTARIAICLLNLALPGLGLLRLASYRASFSYLAFIPLSLVSILWIYATVPTFTFWDWTLLLATAGLITLAVIVATIVATWRSSRYLHPRHGWLWRWYGILGVVIIVLTIDLVIPDPFKYYRSYYCASKSMEPNMRVGDRIFAKMSDLGPIGRGEVVIVQHEDSDYIRRVVAIPGDTISLRNGVVILNNDAVSQIPFSIRRLVDGSRSSIRILEERFPNEPVTHFISDERLSPQDSAAEVHLADGEYFMLGDNRDNALDSRFTLFEGGDGIVDRARIKGRPLFRYWRTGLGFGNGQIK